MRLPPPSLDVAADLGHQAHVGEDLLLEELLHLREVVLDEGDDLLEARYASPSHGIRRCQENPTCSW